MEFWLRYIKQHKKGILIFLLFSAVFLCMFVLYHLPVEAVWYPTLLCTIIGLFFLGADGKKAYQRHKRLTELQKSVAELLYDLPPVETIEGEDYQQLVQKLCEQQAVVTTQMSERYANMMEYYTVWAHQIKTPIASMRLNLQNEDTDFSRQLSEDLQRIEQYVEMVLAFLRLDADSTDYVIKEQNLDEIVRGAIRKFSTQFIRRRLRLVYEPLNVTVISDEKWLGFVVEQVLSNALKYTREGSITIFLEEPKKLCIRDTGIGIAAEDLPRIFENGYTGYNGRSDKKASGIGLYLCKRICTRLGHTITAESEPEKGTTISIDLEQRKLEVE
ncbi:MAG: sensor histidine kinase [Lachnospiraceae bacterium]|nr:sensor histidine kinase [Lachnospiraceae bacterium]